MNALAQALKDLAIRTISDGTEEWGDFPDMLQLVWADARATRHVATLLEQGNVEEAQRALESMDTAPRERAYEALEGMAEE